MGVTEPLKLFVYISTFACNIESTFVCNIRKYFLWPSAPPFCFASVRCINFYRHFWDVFGGVGQHVTARPLIWLPEELWDSKFSFCPHCTTDPDLISQIASALHH